MSVREGWLERDGARLRYLEWPGDRARGVLALHGLSSNARFWTRVAASLGRRFVALDQRSHGRSSDARDSDTIGTFADDARELIAAAGLARPIVVGHSWGAVIALELAARYPRDVSALAFIDGPAWPLAESMSWETFAARSMTPLPRYRSFEEALAAARAYLGTAWGDDLVEFVRDGHTARGEEVVPPLSEPVRARILRELFSYRQDRAWAALRLSALAAFASRKSDLMLTATRRAAERISSVASGVRVKWYDSPHDIPLFHPVEIAGDLAGL